MKFKLALLAVAAAQSALADDPVISLCEAPVTETARKYLGTPYVRAGESPARGFDCSGFTKFVFEQSCGYQLPRSSSQQSRIGVKLDRDELQPGDLLVFREPRRLHMGLYLGEGQFIHAPNRRGSVRVNSLNSAHYRRAFREGRRVLEPVDLTGIYQLSKKVEAQAEPEPAKVKKKTPARKRTPAKKPVRRKTARR